MERWMIVYLLPLEVWMDIFCFPWISRSEFGQLVARIGNFKFAEHAQFYLHEWGKHTLGKLHFSYWGVYNYPNGHLQYPGYPQTAMPENIKFCKSFHIQHFDNRVFNFFHRIQSVLTADTKLTIRYDRKEEVNNVRTILCHLLPLIDGITIKMNDQIMPILKSFPHEKFHQIKVLDVILTRFLQSAVEPIMEWLTTSSNEPKLLQLHCFKHSIDQQQFIESTEPSMFAVIFHTYFEFPTFQCENSIGEQLFGIRNKEGRGKFKVLRHQANAEAGEKLRQWVVANMKKSGMFNWDWDQCIRLSRPTIGDERIFAMHDLDEADNDGKEDEEEKEDENAKPSSSKRRICK